MGSGQSTPLSVDPHEPPSDDVEDVAAQSSVTANCASDTVTAGCGPFASNDADRPTKRSHDRPPLETSLAEPVDLAPPLSSEAVSTPTGSAGAPAELAVAARQLRAAARQTSRLQQQLGAAEVRAANLLKRLSPQAAADRASLPRYGEIDHPTNTDKLDKVRRHHPMSSSSHPLLLCAVTRYNEVQIGLAYSSPSL